MIGETNVGADCVKIFFDRGDSYAISDHIMVSRNEIKADVINLAANCKQILKGHTNFPNIGYSVTFFE